MSKLATGYQRVLLKRAAQHAKHSPDASTKNGAILVCNPSRTRRANTIEEADYPACIPGCNRYCSPRPLGEERHAKVQANRDLKLAWTEHAERVALFTAVRAGANVYGSVLVCPFAACVDCARAMAEFGVAELVRLPAAAFDGFPERWRASIALADEILADNGVVVTEYPDKIGETYFLDGKTWEI